jgi:long-chain acyl-CoA synthetase
MPFKETLVGPVASPAADTFPRLLMEHARVRPDHPALREKNLGIWQTWTWGMAGDVVRRLAAGLHAQGFRRGQHLAIIGENRPRLYFAMMAVQSLGGVPVPLYQDAVAAEMVYVFENAEIEYAIAEDQEQIDKMLEVREAHPMLTHIYYDDPRGLRKYAQAGLMSYDELLAQGAKVLAAKPTLVDDEIAKGRAEDTAALFYTSGTTGKPKGVVQTNHALIDRSRVCSQMEGLTPDEDVLAYMPMAWIGQNIFSYAQALVTGYTVNCPESPATVSNDMREIGPTYYFAPPRVFEGLLTQVMIRMDDASRIKRAMFHYFMEVARNVGGRILDGAPVPLLDRLEAWGRRIEASLEP